MPESRGTVCFLQHDGAVTFRVEGRGTMAQSLPLRRQAEHSLENGLRQLRVDLRACTYMDSTFIGTLLKLRKSAEARGTVEFTLLAPSPACDRILQGMGLGEVFQVQPADPLPEGDWTELSCDLNDLSSFKRTIVQAHEELARLPGPAGEQFQQAVRCLENAPPADATPNPGSARPRE